MNSNPQHPKPSWNLVILSHETDQIPAIVLIFWGDKQAVLKMIFRDTSLHMRHVSRTHREIWHWLLERINLNTNISESTNKQIADILTKGSFTRGKWNELMILFGVVSDSVHRSASPVVAALGPPAHKMAGRSQNSIDEASNVRGASTRPNPEGNRAIALAFVRTSEKFTTDLCSRKDAVRGPEPGKPARHLGTDCVPGYLGGKETVASRWN